MAKSATKTIFVGHKPGMFKAYYGLTNKNETGWHVAFLDDAGIISYPDGEEVYAYRQGAYRRAKQLNALLVSSQAHIAGEQDGQEHGAQWNHQNMGEFEAQNPGVSANDADPTIASFDERKKVAIEKAKAHGYTTPAEIYAYVDGYTAAYVDAMLQ